MNKIAEIINKLIPVSIFIGRDRIRRIGIDEIEYRIGDDDENAIPKALIYSTTALDIPRYLSESSKELMEDAASIARSYEYNELNYLHLFLALLHRQDIVLKLKEAGTEASNLIKSTENKLTIGTVPNYKRGIQVLISKDVQEVIREAINQYPLQQGKVQPLHILVSLLKQRYEDIEEIFINTDSNLDEVTRKIQNEENSH